MTSKYDYLLNKFSQIFESVIFYNYNMTYCNLTFKTKQNINLEHINNICKLEENFVKHNDFYKIQLYNNKILDNYDKNNKLDNHILLYFLNKQTQTKIIIKINNNGIFDISASNRKKQNINYMDIVFILYKLFKINYIDSELIENISINLIQTYSNMIIDINIMNKILKNKIAIDKILSINFNKCTLYIFQTGILLTSSDCNDMIDAYEYMNLLLNEYIFAINNNKMINISDFLMEITL
jgi:hypothetical protein